MNTNHNLAKMLIENGKEVPKIILSGIAKDPDEAYCFSEYLIKNGKEVPEIILSSIAKDCYFWDLFIDLFLKSSEKTTTYIPEERSIKKDLIYNCIDALKKSEILEKELLSIIEDRIEQNCNFGDCLLRDKIKSELEKIQNILTQLKDVK